MNPATAGGPYKVPRQHDGWRSLALAGAMHLGLLLFLWIGISWQNSKPVAVEAEIWDAQVQQAAPAPKPEPAPEPEPEPEPAPAPKAPPPPVAPPVETPPAPKAPDIALERQKARLKAEQEKQEAAREAKLKQEAEEKQAKLEAKKAAEKKAAEQKAREEKEARELAEKEKAEKEKADKDKAEKEKKLAAEKKAKAEKAAQAKLDAVRAEEMKRITGAVGAGTTGTAAKSTGPKGDPSYEAAIRAKIKGNLVYSTADDTLSATFIITQLPTGEVIGIRKKKGSGSAAYDNAIENAITKSSPLPKKKDGTVEREIIADFNMKDLH